MKICCKVNTVNTTAPAARPSPCKSVILLTKDRKEDAVSFSLQSAKTPPRAYNLRNVSCVHQRLIEQGKMSLTFKTPPHMLMISEAQPVELKAILTALKTPAQFLAQLAEDGPMNRYEAREVKVRPDILSLRITEHKQYPSHTGLGFPPSLLTLVITSMRYRHFDTRILRLKQLTKLDLSHNQLKKVPEGLWSMSLNTLDLSRNLLVELPVVPRGASMTMTLQHLDLSDNKLTLFPNGLGYITKLNTLKLSSNNIQVIPHAVKNIATTLRHLSMVNCKLRVLPAAMNSLSLDSLDLSGNQFPHTTDDTVYIVNPRPVQEVASLQECVVKSIIRHSVSVPEDLPPHLTRYLSSTQYCKHCSRMVLDSAIQFLYPLTTMKSFASSFTLMQYPVTVQGYACTKACWRALIKGKRVKPSCVFIKPILYF